MGIGLAITALGGIPVLVAPGTWGAVLASISIMAAGEALVGSALLSRIASGHHWRAKPVFASLALGAVFVANLPSGFTASLPPEQQAAAGRLLLLAAIGVTGIAGVALAVFHRPLSRLAWPELAGVVEGRAAMNTHT